MNEYYVVYLHGFGWHKTTAQVEKSYNVTLQKIKDWEDWFSYEHGMIPCKVIGVTKLDN